MSVASASPVAPNTAWAKRTDSKRSRRSRGGVEAICAVSQGSVIGAAASGPPASASRLMLAASRRDRPSRSKTAFHNHCQLGPATCPPAISTCVATIHESATLRRKGCSSIFQFWSPERKASAMVRTWSICAATGPGPVIAASRSGLMCAAAP